MFWQGSPIDSDSISFADNEYSSTYAIVSNNYTTFSFDISYNQDMYDISGVNLTLTYSNIPYPTSIPVPTTPIQATLIYNLQYPNSILRFNGLVSGTLSGEVLIPYKALTGDVTVTNGTAPLDQYYDFWDDGMTGSKITARKSGLGSYVQPEYYAPTLQEEYIRWPFTWPAYSGDGTGIQIDFKYYGDKLAGWPYSAIPALLTLTMGAQFLNYPLTITGAFTGMKEFKISIPKTGIISNGTIENLNKFSMTMKDGPESYDQKQDTATDEGADYTFTFIISEESNTNGEGTGSVEERIQSIIYKSFNYYTNGALLVNIERINPYDVVALGGTFRADFQTDQDQYNPGTYFNMILYLNGFEDNIRKYHNFCGPPGNMEGKPELIFSESLPFSSSSYNQVYFQFNPSENNFINPDGTTFNSAEFQLTQLVFATWRFVQPIPFRFVFYTPEGQTCYYYGSIYNDINHLGGGG